MASSACSSVVSVSTASSCSLKVAQTHRSLQRHRPSIVDLAEECGIMDLSPSDLVCESSALGVSYYDFVVSSSTLGTPEKDGATLYLSKFDANTNLESLDSTYVSPKVFADYSLPSTDLALAVLGMLTYKQDIARSRVLCLVRRLDQESMTALEALKRVAQKFKCLHHVQASRPPKPLTQRTAARPNEGMRLRVMLCQSRATQDAPPNSAVREAKALLEPSSNPLLCLCFNIS